jgi:hypothetical protein
MRGAPAVARTWSVRRNSTDVTEYCEAGRARRGVRSQSSAGRCASWRGAEVQGQAASVTGLPGATSSGPHQVINMHKR